MRFSIPLVVLSSFLFAGLSQAFVGPSCMKMKDSLGNKPDGIFKKFDSQVCKKGCKPVIAHWDKWAKKNVAIPAINMVMKKMGVPQHTKAVIDLAHHVMETVKKECVPRLKGKHLCQDPETLTAFGNCLKGNLMPVIMGHVGELMPLVAEPMCVKEKAYLESPDLWEKIIPKYLDAYAKVCKKL
jgi:hypothetical protein